MVVGRRERADVDLENTAVLFLDGMRFEGQDVRGDLDAPLRRDVFIGGEVREAFPGRGLPERGRVRWHGRMYDVVLSFRTGVGGQAIPVYQFFVESRL